jgi:hypothetical protein
MWRFRPGKDQMRASWAVESRRFYVEDRRLPAGSEAMGGPPRCRDLCPCRRAAQMANDNAAYADGLLSGKGIGEDLPPLRRAKSTRASALDLHAPQCRGQLWQPVGGTLCC